MTDHEEFRKHLWDDDLMKLYEARMASYMQTPRDDSEGEVTPINNVPVAAPPPPEEEEDKANWGEIILAIISTIISIPVAILGLALAFVVHALFLAVPVLIAIWAAHKLGIF